MSTELKRKIEDHLKEICVNTKVCSKGKYKIIVEIPPYKCYRNNFGGSIGFKMKIGKNDFIEIPLDMLVILYDRALSNRKIYERQVFAEPYKKLIETKPCYVHAVGGILESAKLARKQGNKYLLEDLKS